MTLAQKHGIKLENLSRPEIRIMHVELCSIVYPIVVRPSLAEPDDILILSSFLLDFEVELLLPE